MSTETMSKLPSIRNLTGAHTGHIDLRNGGYYWYRYYPSHGFTNFEGKDRRSDNHSNFFIFGTDDDLNEDLKRYPKHEQREFLQEYWRRNPDKYAAACVEQGIEPLAELGEPEGDPVRLLVTHVLILEVRDRKGSKLEVWTRTEKRAPELCTRADLDPLCLVYDSEWAAARGGKKTVKRENFALETFDEKSDEKTLTATYMMESFRRGDWFYKSLREFRFSLDKEATEKLAGETLHQSTVGKVRSRKVEEDYDPTAICAGCGHTRRDHAVKLPACCLHGNTDPLCLDSTRPEYGTKRSFFHGCRCTGFRPLAQPNHLSSEEVPHA